MEVRSSFGVVKYLSRGSITLMDAGNLVNGTEFPGDKLFNLVKKTARARNNSATQSTEKQCTSHA